MFDFLFNPNGRISRKGFWLGFSLPYAAISIVLGLLEEVAGIFVVVSAVVSLFYLWPSQVAVPIRRLHDLGRSGWWLALYYLSWIVVIGLVGAAVGYVIASQDAAGSTALQGLTLEEQRALFVQNIVPALGTPLGIAGVVLWVALSIGYVVVIGVLPGQIGDNRFGRDPHAEGRGFAD